MRRYKITFFILIHMIYMILDCIWIYLLGFTVWQCLCIIWFSSLKQCYIIWANEYYGNDDSDWKLCFDRLCSSTTINTIVDFVQSLWHIEKLSLFSFIITFSFFLHLLSCFVFVFFIVFYNCSFFWQNIVLIFPTLLRILNAWMLNSDRS